MKAKKKVLLIPSAYNHKALGDIEGFIPFYKDDFDVYVITDEEYPNDETVVDGVHYVTKKTSKSRYLEVTSDYVIDAGAITGSNKMDITQKRVSVWHGIPYKSMFVELGREHIITALDYATNFDLMVSPSKWYSERFLRDMMLYDGEILETCVSRTDSLYLTDQQTSSIRKELGIPEGKRVLLYAPTFREEGEFALPFSPEKVQSVLGEDWVIVLKLHYLNTVENAHGCIDATEYPLVNNLLAIADLLVTDYSSLFFDYSILEKPALFFQYDREEYERTRSFGFELEDYVDQSAFVFTEAELLARLKDVNDNGLRANLERIRENFYPHQHPNATADLVEQLAFEPGEREVNEVIFLVNELNQIGGVHAFVLNLAKQFKERFNSKIIVIGNNEFDGSKDKAYVFESGDLVDVKLSAENHMGLAKSVLSSTNGYIISCQYGVHLKFQKYLKGQRSILMFHGDTKDIVNRNIYTVHLDGYNQGAVYNFRRLAFLSKGNWQVINEHLVGDARKKSIYIENGMEFGDAKNLYAPNYQFAFVSRLDKDKNPMEVIDIFADERLDERFHLHIYGDGALMHDMQERIDAEGLAEKITMHGYVGDKEEIYRDKQGVISVSLTEGLPYTLVESIKYGIPVYVYDSFTSCRDIVSDSNGVLIPTSDKDAFVDALLAGFDMSHFDNSELIETFSNETVTNKWKKVFDELDAEVASEVEEVSTEEPEKKPSKKPSLKSRVKKAIRKSSYFSGNQKYAELSAKWRSLKASGKGQDMPLVSVVMPFYNNGDTVEQAVRSVDKNGYDNYEILLVNDGSSENPMQGLKKYRKIRYFYKPNGGLSSTRNFAMDRCKGKYVIFLDSDDMLYPGCLMKLIQYAEENELQMVNGRTIRRYVSLGEDEIWYKGIYKKSFVSTKRNRFRIIDDTIATGKLYSLEMLRELGMRFADGLYEDILFTGEIYARLDRIGVLSANTQLWMVYGQGTSITTRNTLASAEARLKNVGKIFDMQSDFSKVYYTRQFIRQTIVVSLSGYIYFNDSEKAEIYQVLRDEMLKREPYLVESLIIVPSKKLAYQSLLDGDFEKFDLIAEGFSQKYVAIHESRLELKPENRTIS